MTELDKFKRRTIRSVARLLRQKKPPDELWGEMKKETGTDCRVLWERMRALCIKKLNRMLAVDDRSDSLPSIARLSLTDWLLVDLVLVHEKIDVIAMEKVDNKAEQKPLVQLFNLVQRFDVEGRAGDALAEAWAAATVFYNRQGRQCSPMLLQRRWYQLKKLTRCRFYKFWQSYRGNTRLLAEARGTMPTRLQMAVAKRYPAVITGTFPDWEELIEQKLIIMPEEFESKMRLPDLPKPCNSSDPDLVVVEPVIETIELAEDSDTEEPKGVQIEDTPDPESSNDAAAETDPPLKHETMQSDKIVGVNIKSEPIEEDGLSNVQVIAPTHVTELEIPDESPELDSEVSCHTVEKRSEDNLVNDDDDDDIMCADSPKQDDESPIQPDSSEANVEKISSSSPDSEDDVIEIPSIAPAINIDFKSPTEAPTDEIMPVISTVKTEKVNDVLVDDIIKLKADEYCRKDTEEISDESKTYNTVDDLIKYKDETFLETPKDTIKFEEKKPDVSAINIRSETLDLTAIDLMADLNFNDDGLEFIDDGVEFLEEMDEPKREPVTKASPDHESTRESEDTNKFDLKLLMDPVVYTTKLDHMNIFKNTHLSSVSNKEDIDKIIVESRPVSKKSFNININKEEDTASQIDDLNNIDDSGVNDDLFTNQESDDENLEEITVSPNSYILKKPRTRTYNPIQLCKNPDFNTKLRRLAIGFFSSPRNRQLLNACIPMTIDVTKAFESKLVNGTLYLKSTGRNSNVVKEAVIDNQSSTSVLPSALPVQSLLDNSKSNILNLIPTPTIDLTPTPTIDLTPTPRTDSILSAPIGSTSTPNIDVIPNPSLTTNVNPVVTERKKIISLPDIDKVRRINQQLLTAQVPPIRVYAGDSYRPPVQPITAVTTQIEQIKPPEALQAVPAETVSAPPTPPPQASCLPTVVKVESEAAHDDKGLLTTTETIPLEPLPPAKQKLLKIINQAKLTTQEALTKIDGGCKAMPTDGLKQLTLARKIKPKPNGNAYKKPNMYNRISVPWTPRFAPRPESIDDFLITDDTLNKMLHLMSGNEDEKSCACCSVKQKKADSNKAYKAKKKKERNKSANDSAKMTQEKSTENQAAGDLDVVDTDSNDPPQNAGEKPKPVLAKGRVVKYCCWARQKIWNRRRITKHTCQPNECVCCCRDALAQFVEDKKKSVPIEVSDDEDKSLKMACESIENVVQQSRETTDNITPQKQITPKTKLVIMRTISTSTDTNSLAANPTDNIVSFNQGVVNEPETPKVPPPVITKIIPQSQLPTLFTRKRPSPKPNMPLYVPSSKEPLCVPCPCQKPEDTPAPQLSIVIDASRNVVLDASKKCNIHVPALTPIAPKEKENKILYLHSKSISKSPTESPIFLGKNKILLTTVKFPRKNEAPLQECEAFQAPKIIPTLPLPNGVQLVLLPSGSVTYTLDQGVELTEEQLATLPTIIAAVKEQLESSTVPSFAPMSTANNPSVTNDGQPLLDVPHPQLIANTQIVDLPAAVNLEAHEVFQDEDLPQKNIRHEELDTIANTAVDIPTVPVNTEKMDTELNLNEIANNAIADSDKKNVTSPSSNANLAIHTETQAIADSETRTEVECVVKPGLLPETQSVTEPDIRTDVQNPVTETAAKNSNSVDESNDKDGASNRKTLLSDLMEMSGISAEDATAAEPPATELAAQEQVPVFINSEQDRNLPELTPVTSFAELKYACEHDGKFFKLDFETGVIVPINVCIKKNAKPKGPARVKAVIDLTDDMEDSDDITSTQDPEPQPEVNTFASTFQQYVYRGKTVTVPNTTIKPVKLFKAVHPPSLLQRQVKLDPKSYSLPSAPKNPPLRNRKQIFSKVEAVLDLVDSDAPMEEEYLMESSDGGSSDSESSRTDTGSMIVEALEELDYSSDDEPLAKKSKRMKETNEENDKDKIIETNIRDAINIAVSENPNPVDPSDGQSDVTKDVDVPMESVDTPRDGDKEPLSSNDTQPTTEPAGSVLQPELDSELNPDVDPEVDPDLDPNGDPELRFMSGPSDNEGGEEDCILGV